MLLMHRLDGRPTHGAKNPAGAGERPAARPAIIIPADALLSVQRPQHLHKILDLWSILRLKFIHRRLGFDLPQQDKKLSVVKPRRTPAPP